MKSLRGQKVRVSGYLGCVAVLVCALVAQPTLLARGAGASQELPVRATGSGTGCGSSPSTTCRFFVSTQGRDSWPGTQRQPFATVHRAQRAVREINSRSGAAVVVTLSHGTHYLRRPLELTAADSGEHGRPVVWRAAPGARPVLSGGREIRDWSPIAGNRGIYRARFRGNTRQLFVDGERAVRARQAGLDRNEFTKTGTGFEVEGSAARLLAGLARPTDAEFVSWYHWRMHRCGVAGIEMAGEGDAQRAIVRLDQPCFRNANLTAYNPKAWNIGPPNMIEGALEFLDEPGEWYLDKDGGWLYYKPRPGEDLRRGMSKVVAPVLETLVAGIGKINAPVHDIHFVGLTFADATWLHPSSPAGYVPDQTMFRFPDDGGDKQPTWAHPFKVDRTPGNVRFRFAHRIKFVNDRFARLGSVALDFDTGSQKNSVIRSRFTDLSGTAIQLGGVDPEDHHPSDPRQVTRDNHIADNSITRVGLDYYDGLGIFVGYTTRSNIEHNYLAHLPYSAISVGWGWGLTDPGGHHEVDSWTNPPRKNAGWPVYQTPTTSSGNRVAANRMDDYMNELSDGAAVYVLGAQGPSLARGMTIEENVATEQHGPMHMLYSDLGSRYQTWRRNVVASPSNPSAAVLIAELMGVPRTDLLDALPRGPLTAAGGWGPYGDLRYEGNYWTPVGGPVFLCCSTSGTGGDPVNVETRDNTTILTLDQAPREIVDAAGPRP